MEENVQETFIPETNQNMSKNQAKKRARKLLKKNKKGKPGENAADGKQSKILCKIIERRNRGCKEIETLALCKEYMKIAIMYGNRFGNTKYVINYILRTHKEEEETFHMINYSKTMKEMAKVREI